MKSEYGVRALADLAHHYGEGPISSHTIALRHSIPQPFLDQLMATLRRAGLVRSLRGYGGGYELIPAPDEIRVSDAITALDGFGTPIPCLDAPNVCPLSPRCLLQPVWTEVHDATTSILSALTIADLAEREQVSGPYHYSI